MALLPSPPSISLHPMFTNTHKSHSLLFSHSPSTLSPISPEISDFLTWLGAESPNGGETWAKVRRHLRKSRGSCNEGLRRAGSGKSARRMESTSGGRYARKDEENMSPSPASSTRSIRKREICGFEQFPANKFSPVSPISRMGSHASWTSASSASSSTTSSLGSSSSDSSNPPPMPPSRSVSPLQSLRSAAATPLSSSSLSTNHKTEPFIPIPPKNPARLTRGNRLSLVIPTTENYLEASQKHAETKGITTGTGSRESSRQTTPITAIYSGFPKSTSPCLKLNTAAAVDAITATKSSSPPPAHKSDAEPESFYYNSAAYTYFQSHSPTSTMTPADVRSATVTTSEAWGDSPIATVARSHSHSHAQQRQKKAKDVTRRRAGEVVYCELPVKSRKTSHATSATRTTPRISPASTSSTSQTKRPNRNSTYRTSKQPHSCEPESYYFRASAFDLTSGYETTCTEPAVDYLESPEHFYSLHVRTQMEDYSGPVRGCTPVAAVRMSSAVGWGRVAECGY